MRLVLLDNRLPGERAWWRIRVKASGEVIDAFPVVAAAMVRAGAAELVDDDGRIVKNAILNVREIRAAANRESDA